MAVILELTIGGEVKPVTKLPFRQNQDFKKKLIETAKKVMPKVNSMATVPADLANEDTLIGYVETMLTNVDGLLEDALQIVVDYDVHGALPKTIDQEIVDEEIIDAFLCVINAAVPLKKLKVLAAGFSSIG